MNVSSVKNLNGEVFSAVQDATLTNVIQTNSGNWQDITAYQNASATYLTGVSIPESATWNEVSTTVQTNSAQWGQGGGAISSYTTEWCHDVPPYGDNVINRLNEKYLKAFVSDSADKAKQSINSESANSAGYAQEVNETYVENKGFVRNLSSEYGTISVIHNKIIESTNSAIVRTGNEGFVSSFDSASIGPEGNGTVTFSWDKALPNTIINLDMSWSHNEVLTYSANTNLTGEIVLPTGVNTQTINIPNATEFKVWSNIWIGLNSAVVSAADQFETTLGELAWASALPTYEYDTSTNKISAINGSALGGGGEIPTGTMNVSGLEYNAVNEISAYNGSAIAQYGAEKQWLVHDDTLVHAANSSQYALGVNVSALQRLMGIDETVLWSGTLASGSTASLSENITAFNKIAFVGYSHNGSNYVVNGESNVNGTSLALVGLTYWPGEVDFVECRISNTTLTCDGTIVLSPTQGNKVNGYITKVVGIGRKA